MRLEEILEQWEKDCKIDQNRLDEVAANCPLLHSKYLGIYSKARLTLKKKQMDMDSLKKDKWLYFNGKMTRPEMDQRGWPYDPFNGMAKPMKSDMEMFYATDPDISALNGVIEYQKVIVDTLDEIVNNIKWRHSTIKNMIDYMRFQAGN